MTVLSAALGYATTVISRVYTFYSSVILFVAFGLKMLKEGYEMSPTHGQVHLNVTTRLARCTHRIAKIFGSYDCLLRVFNDRASVLRAGC